MSFFIVMHFGLNIAIIAKNIRSDGCTLRAWILLKFKIFRPIIVPMYLLFLCLGNLLINFFYIFSFYRRESEVNTREVCLKKIIVTAEAQQL